MPLRRPAALVALLATAATSLALVPAPAALAASSGLVVSQVYGGGGNSGAPLTHDFVELVNRGASPVSTAGLSVQYASATGTGLFLVGSALPAATVPPGGAFLVQMAGGTNGAPLPTPDAVGTSTMAAGAGKVALVTGTTGLECNGGSAPCSAEQRARIVDLVGYGGADFFEGDAAAPGLSNSTAAARLQGGCQDTDRNGADFRSAAPAPRTSASPAVVCAPTTPPPAPEPDLVLVSAVQGTGAATPLAGRRVTVEAVVTSLLTRNDVLDGFFVQEEDADADADPATAEGLFVFCRTLCPAGLAAGDLVRVTGTASEGFGMTQLSASAAGSSITTVERGVALPAAVPVDLPAGGRTDRPETYEAVEGMLAVFPGTLVVSETFQLDRFGQLVLTAGERPYQFTHTSAPSVEGYAAFQDDLAGRRIVLDDDTNDQNDTVSGPVDEAYPYPTPGLSTTNRVRGGDTVTGLTGVLHWSFAGQSGTDAWRVRPVPGRSYAFEPGSERTARPDEVGGRLRAASFNVLNYFTAFGTTCGPTGDQDCRGADSPAELERQRSKVVAALAAMDADVVGLIEIQNSATDEAVRDLVAALNRATGEGTYAFVPTGLLGTDAITQALVYKPAVVRPVGDHAALTPAVDARFTARNRPALAQAFEELATGERFVYSVNHFKSKGSGCGPGDDSPADGSGSCDGTRTAAARALAEWLATDPTGSGDADVLVMGDLNSYRLERPITALRDAGFADLVERYQGDEGYGYVFDGQLGYLDHALATADLVPQVTGATEWHINADEPTLLDYQDGVRDAGEPAFERRSQVLPLFAPDPYRSSDHDPVLVGLELGGPLPVADAGGPYAARVGERVQLDASGSTGSDLAFAWDLDGDGAFDDATGPAPVLGPQAPGRSVVAVRVTDGRTSSVAEAPLTVSTPGRGNDGTPPGRG